MSSEAELVSIFIRCTFNKELDFIELLFHKGRSVNTSSAHLIKRIINIHWQNNNANRNLTDILFNTI